MEVLLAARTEDPTQHPKTALVLTLEVLAGARASRRALLQIPAGWRPVSRRRRG
jgi:hypothetical protein